MLLMQRMNIDIEYEEYCLNISGDIKVKIEENVI